MILQVSKELGVVLTNEDYTELLLREVKEYGYKDIYEAIEQDTEYKQLNISFDDGEVLDLSFINNSVKNEIEEQLGINNYRTPLDYDSAENILDDECVDFELIKGYKLRIEFEVVLRYSEEDYSNVIAGDSLVRVTSMSLVE